MTQQTKICTKCKRELPATNDFFYFTKVGYKGKIYNDGLRYHCRDCMNEYKRAHRIQVAKTRKLYHKKTYERDQHLNMIHIRVKKIKPSQKHCSICNQKKKLELSSIDGLYSEDPNAYWWLCHECHHLYDRENKTHLEVNKKDESKKV